MGVVIDEVITEIEQPTSPRGADRAPTAVEDPGRRERESGLRSRLERIQERRLRLSAD